MKVLEKTLDVVECLDDDGAAELGTIAERTGLPRSTVHHHLADLERRGFVVNDDGTYHIALRFLEIGERARRRSHLFQTAQSEIDELSQSLDRPVALCVLEQDQVVVLDTRGEDPGIPVTLHAGQHLPLHATAPGKAILDASKDRTLLDGQTLEAYTEHTVTDREAIAAAVTRASERGYAVAREERWPGRCGIAAPFSTRGGGLAAAIEVALTPERARDVDLDEFAAKIERAVSVIDIKSDYSR